MPFDHSKLLGRIRECGYTQKSLAKAINMNVGTLTQKLKNRSHFTTEEMLSIGQLLDISSQEMGAYFFKK